MAIFSAAELRATAQREVTKAYGYSGRSARDMLLAEAREYRKKEYDIFLSQSFRDADLILGLANAIKALGFSVYVDWIEDPTLDRQNVTAPTAAALRERMRNCRSFL